MSDMYFDVNSFNFDDLTDVIALDYEDTKKGNRQGLAPVRKLSDEVGADGGIPSDAMDLIEYSGVNIGDDEDDTDYNNDISDILAKEKEQHSLDARNMFNGLDEDHTIDFGDGFEMSKSQLKELFKAKAKVDNDSSYFAEQAQRFDNDNKMINQRALMQQTVLENNINVLSNRLNNPNLPDHEYAATAKQLQVAQASLMQLNNEVNAVMQKRYEQEQQINGFRIRSADQQMNQQFPQWNNHKGQILDYLVQENNIPSSTLEKVYDKGFMTIALKAYLYDQNKKRVIEQTNGVNARSSKGAKTSTRNQKSEEVNQIEAGKALARIGSSKQANIDAFKYLK